jgi:hypothetical protein
MFKYNNNDIYWINFVIIYNDYKYRNYKQLSVIEASFVYCTK